jgi:hypothetical protein
MRRNLRTTTLAAVVLAASALSLPGSAQASPWGWHGGCCWGGVGPGLAAGLIIGGALSSPYPYYAYPGPYYRHRVYVRPRYWLY